MNFRGKRVLITGASSGIGEEFAKQFHKEGSEVVLVARRRELLDSFAEELNKERQGSATVICADITKDKTDSSDGVRAVLSYIESNQIDILINNAGIGSFGYFESRDVERECSMVDLNITATVRLAHAALTQMKERQNGALISVSSIAGFQPIPFMATYSATKAFNFVHSLALRYELSRFGVRVLTVCPGPVATEFGGVARIPGTVTGKERDSVQNVVRESISALRRNKAFVVPCFGAKLMALPSRLLPVSVSTWIVERTLRRVWGKSKAS